MARPRSDISERLVKAARAHFLSQGVDGASLREIAAEAGTSVGMVSYYFATKDDLFLAVIEHVYPRLLAAVREALASEGTLQKRIERVFTRMHAMDDEEFAVVRIVVREAMVSSERLKKLFARFGADGSHIPLLTQALAVGMEEGEVRQDVPPLALLASVMGLGMAPVVVRRLAGGAGLKHLLPLPEEAAAAMAKILFGGIGAPSQAPQRKPRAAGRARRK